MKWGIICKPCEQSFSLGKKIYGFLSDQADVLPETKLAKTLHTNGYSIKALSKKVDRVITIGGDGTILMALEYISQPIFPINTGAVGFLTEVDEKDALKGLKQVLRNDYYIEDRVKLKIMLNNKRLPDGANEVTVQTPLIGKILEFNLFVEGKIVEELEGDGIIIATPTGSTSYALSVGGPIVDPTINVLVVAPVAPFRHYSAPLVIPSDKELAITLCGKREAQVAIDGHHTYPLRFTDTLRVTTSEVKARFIRLENKFYQRVYEKLCRRR